jgi:hypothetical protein
VRAELCQSQLRCKTGAQQASAAVWMELGLLGAAGVVPVIVVVAAFRAANLRRGGQVEPRQHQEWVSSSGLRSPD